MQDPITLTRSGFAEPRPLTSYEVRIAALEDHLARETRSSQALAARVKELEALCKVLGVVPEFTPGTEPTFLPIADLRDAEVLHAKQVLGLPEVPLLLPSEPPIEVRWRHDVLKDTGRTSVRHLPLSEMRVEGVGGFTDSASGQWIPCITAHKSGAPRDTIIDSAPLAWTEGPQPQVFIHTNGKIVLAFASPCGEWSYQFAHTFAEAVTLRDHLTAATAKGREFFEAVCANEQARDASKGAK